MPMTDPTGAAGAMGAAANAQSQRATSLGQMDSEAFLKLLVAQMRYQDPMEPADHTEMLQQTAMFTQVEALNQVSQQQSQLLGLGQAQMASDLIGKDITAEVPGEGTVTGLVEAVRFTDHGPMLRLADGEVPFQYAIEVRDVDATPPPAESPPEGGDEAVAPPEEDEPTADGDDATAPDDGVDDSPPLDDELTA